MHDKDGRHFGQRFSAPEPRSGCAKAEWPKPCTVVLCGVLTSLRREKLCGEVPREASLFDLRHEAIDLRLTQDLISAYNKPATQVSQVLQPSQAS